MPVTETLSFESARTLYSLYAGENSCLREAEKMFRVKITSRDGWLKVEGKEEGVRGAKELFGQLQIAQDKGVKIRPHEFRYAMGAVKAGQSVKLDKLWDTKIEVSHKKSLISPKTFTQYEYIQIIAKEDLVFGIGPAGTGKTYLAVAMAVAALKEGEVNRIILTRPAVEAGEALGFLPGDLKEKIFPYLRPLYDALYEMMDAEEVQRCAEKGTIEVAPLAYMRGRTLDHAFIILDEAQNTTTEQMFMFLTRIGTDSKCVVTGDPTQVDLPRNKKSGLFEAEHALRNIDGISFIRFDEKDVVRHGLVTRIIRAYKGYRGARQTSTAL